MVEVPGQMLLHHTFVVIHLGSYFRFFGLAFDLIRSRRWIFLLLDFYQLSLVGLEKNSLFCYKNTLFLQLV